MQQLQQIIVPWNVVQVQVGGVPHPLLGTGPEAIGRWLSEMMHGNTAPRAVVEAELWVERRETSAVPFEVTTLNFCGFEGLPPGGSPRSDVETLLKILQQRR